MEKKQTIYNVVIVCSTNGDSTIKGLKSFKTYELAVSYMRTIYEDMEHAFSTYADITINQYCLEGFKLECEFNGTIDCCFGELIGQDCLIDDPDAPYSLYINCECVCEYDSLDDAKEDAEKYLETDENAIIDIYSYKDTDCEHPVWYKNE